MHIHPFDTPHDAYIHSLGGVIYSGSLCHATSLEFAPLSPPVTDSHPLLSTPSSDDDSPCPLPLKRNETTSTKTRTTMSIYANIGVILRPTVLGSTTTHLVTLSTMSSYLYPIVQHSLYRQGLTRLAISEPFPSKLTPSQLSSAHSTVFSELPSQTCP